MEALTGQEIIDMLDKCADGRALNNQIEIFNMDMKAKPREVNKRLLLNEKFIKIFGEVFTPIPLIEDMLNALPPEAWANKNLKWLDPSCGTCNFNLVIKERLMQGLKKEIPDYTEREKWILEQMIYGVDIQERNAILGKMRLDPENKYKTHIEAHDSLAFDFWDLKFDIVVGNPPYNNDSGNQGAGNTLWDKFVIMVFEKITKPTGYICLVHPSLWRKPGHKMRSVIKNIHYLEIHSDEDGQRIFGAQTRYDWYIASPSVKPKDDKTRVKDQNGKVMDIDLAKMSFIPNCEFDLVEKLLAKNGEKRLKVINDRSSYGADKEWVSKDKTDEYKYPCVYMVRVNNEPELRWSKTNNNGHFGIPKVIYGSGVATGVLVDSDGEYGMTQWASGIVAPSSELKDIAKAILSDKFQEFRGALSMSKIEINSSVLSLFRKDFWREFLDE